MIAFEVQSVFVLSSLHRIPVVKRTFKKCTMQYLYFSSDNNSILQKRITIQNNAHTKQQFFSILLY